MNKLLQRCQPIEFAKFAPRIVSKINLDKRLVKSSHFVIQAPLKLSLHQHPLTGCARHAHLGHTKVWVIKHRVRRGLLAMSGKWKLRLQRHHQTEYAQIAQLESITRTKPANFPAFLSLSVMVHSTKQKRQQLAQTALVRL
jgi:hypothetical protein